MTTSQQNGDSVQEPAAVGPNAESDIALPTDIEAVEINEVLYVKYYDAAGATWWWNNPNSELGGKTPHQVWLSETRPSSETMEKIRRAAHAAPKMGHAL
jgi:hypothetical protein